MRLFVYAATIFLSLSQIALAAPPKKLFDVSFEDIQGGGRILKVGFYEKLPSPTAIDKIVRESLDHAILIDPTKEIFATAFLGDDVLNSNQYSGELIYRADQKKVVTYEEYRGVKTSVTSSGNYFIEIQEEKTLEGIKPEKKWLSITIVFPKKPSQQTAYDAIITEAQKLDAKGLDMNLYVSVGDKNAKTSWKQIRDTDGTYIAADYDAASKRLMHQNKLIKQI